MARRCTQCATELTDNAKFCRRCGTPAVVEERHTKPVPAVVDPLQTQGNRRTQEISVTPAYQPTEFLAPEEAAAQSAPSMAEPPAPPPPPLPPPPVVTDPLKTQLNRQTIEVPVVSDYLRTEEMTPANFAPPALTEELPAMATPAPLPPPPVLSAPQPTPAETAQTAAPAKKKAKPAPSDSAKAVAPGVPKVAAAAPANAASGGRKWLTIALPVLLLAVVGAAVYAFKASRPETTSALLAEPSPTATVIAELSPTPAAVVPSESPLPEPTLVVAELKPEAGKKLKDGKPTPTATPALANKDTATMTTAPNAYSAATPKPAAPVAYEEKKPQPAAPAPVLRTADAVLKQGIAFLGSGRYAEALREFEQAQQLSPGNKDIYYLTGQAYHQLGRLDQALNAYRQCTTGAYAAVAKNHVSALEKKLGKAK